ncbi:hypothetical protein NQ315_011196 [Exocentrus adspersus]|uniref:DDE Tnp4 domain-containing protein n=1 Tax=Exocentrus adspersus TaxID=1586481 RepID=A0AAV8V6K3_9CUCU|nr:hypothetical protein NQ315_011196 [Exocentrus adspersus]
MYGVFRITPNEDLSLRRNSEKLRSELLFTEKFYILRRVAPKDIIFERSFREDKKNRECRKRKNGLQDSRSEPTSPVKPKNYNQVKNCIYEFSGECGKSNIGETKRPFKVRIKEEHQTLIRLGNTEKSRIAQHVWEEQQHWDQATIIAKEQGWKKRKLKEAAFIAITLNCISTTTATMNPIMRHLLLENDNQLRRYRLRIQKRVMRDQSNPFQLTDRRFIELFRLNKELTINLSNELIPHMEDCIRNTRIPKQTRILIALRFFAVGSYQRCVGEEYLLSSSQQTVSRCIMEVSQVMVQHLSNQYPGSTNDAFIWRVSAIHTILENDHGAGIRNTWLLGDSGYPLQPWLMTPFEDPAPNTPEANYNVAHKITRSTIERCIGVLKARFRCIMGERKLRYAPEKVGNIIYACGILHNMCIRAAIPVERVEENILADELNAVPNHPVVGNILNEGRQIRAEIVNHAAVCFFVLLRGVWGIIDEEAVDGFSLLVLLRGVWDLTNEKVFDGAGLLTLLGGVRDLVDEGVTSDVDTNGIKVKISQYYIEIEIQKGSLKDNSSSPSSTL